MNKAQAIAEMRKGKEVTHKSFSDNEWMSMDNNDDIITEDGCIRSSHEFWRWRDGEEWDDGYSLFDDDITPD